MAMESRWIEAAASSAQTLLHRCLPDVFGDCWRSEWEARFVDRICVLAPELPAETLANLASHWRTQDVSVTPEDAAQSAVLWIRSGGIGT
jgi:hypothetical protein